MATTKMITPASKRPGMKLRVAAYCRVSSNSADQQNSYIRQVDAYTRLVSNNPAWELVDIFADAGISGMKADNREQFQRMIRMCELHQIDMIITKSVSRFARNVKEALEYCRKLTPLGIGVKFEKEGIFTLSMGDEMLLNTFDCLNHVRALKNHGIGIYFEKQNIDTLSIDSELYLVIYAGFAQSESESMSKNITWAYRKRFEDGKVTMQYKLMLGYKKGPDGEPEIVPEEAEIVKRTSAGR